MQPMITGFPGERVGLDIIGPLPISVRGHEYILVMIDYFTKWVEAIPLLHQDAQSVANAITHEWVSRWGAPLAFHSDCGSNFNSRLFREVCQLLDVHKTRTTPYHPEGNGLVERTNRTLKNTLLAFIQEDHEHAWDIHLPFCLLAYRGSIHSTTGFTPHFLNTGRDLRLPSDLTYPLQTADPMLTTEYGTRLRQVIRQAHNAARSSIQTAATHQKTNHDRTCSGQNFQTGDLVLHFNPIPPRGTTSKFHHPWRGPFVILDTFPPTNLRLRDAVQPQATPFTAHFSKLKPYRGRLPTCSFDTLPILPSDQVPLVAVEVVIPAPSAGVSTEDSAQTYERGNEPHRTVRDWRDV
uniref:Integrase catalytic domain-containing protein n=1 Tax=Schistocephalus solidus TaxID=70667 RepID=A0A0X3NU41_SCHSO